MTDVIARPDTPRSAYQVLERRTTLATAGVLLVLSALAWWVTVGRSHSMSDMVQGIAQIGTMAMSFDMSLVIFMAMWTAMMIAMMFPTIAPIVLLHRLVVRRQGAGISATVSLVAGYLLVWVVIGVVPFAILVAARHVTNAATWAPRIGGGIFVVAGLYQFSRWKQACLRACRSPMTFLATHNFRHGHLGTMRTGISHGAYCLGCCWALMSVLFVVGLMNLAWMAVIAVIFLAEKNWRYGVALTQVAGTAATAFGVAVLAHPNLLSSVA